MTGNYPDAPGARMAYDRDGSLMARALNGVVTQLTQAQLNAVNSETDGWWINPSGGAPNYWFIIFPELRDVSGIFLTADWNSQFGSYGPTQWSPNTTTGLDGTWNNVAGHAAAQVVRTTVVKPFNRNNIAPVSLTGVKALRFAINDGNGFSFGWGRAHLYGKPSALTNQQKVVFWHPTLNQPLTDFPTFFDWGDRPRSSTLTKQVRVKNLSGSLTANGVLVSVQALTDTSPAVTGQYTVSYNGGAYVNSLTIPALAPGEVSQVISVQQSLLASAVLGLWTQRLTADPTTWS